MGAVKNTIPVYDICTLDSKNHGNGIIAEPFGSYLLAHPNLYVAHRHSFYHMVLFTAGAGTHTIDFQQFPVRPQQIYFMIPGQVHSWAFEGDTDGFVINFPEDVATTLPGGTQFMEQFPFFQGVAADGVIDLNSQTYQTMITIMDSVVKEVHANAFMASELVTSLLTQLFIHVGRVVPVASEPTPRHHRQLVLHNFRKLVEQYYREKRLPKDYAAELYITPNHLNALCNDLLGKTAGDVIRERILLESKRLLVNAGLTISEIASQLSFTDTSHFTKFFKKDTGITPEEFRRRMLKQ